LHPGFGALSVLRSVDPGESSGLQVQLDLFAQKGI
jgi:hypothetical protein